MTRIRCVLLAEPTISTLPYYEQTPPAAYPGNLKSVRVQGIDGCVFECVSDAHPGKDHQFRVGERILIIPWDKFRLQGKELFLQEEVTWKQSD